MIRIGTLMTLALALTLNAAPERAFGQTIPPRSQAEQRLAELAGQNKYAIVMFYRASDAATEAMGQAVAQGAQSRAARAGAVFVDVSQASEQAIVERFGLARAPLPLTLAVAPNGAITGLYPKTLTDAQIESTFVTPAMAFCMRSMQQGKMVFVCVHSATDAALPQAVQEFQSDPQYTGRVDATFLQAGDPAEARFLEQMQIDPRTLNGSVSVFLAPPGVLVGKFGAAAKKDDIAAALHAAGKCCEDPNCKHAAPGQQAKQGAGGQLR